MARIAGIDLPRSKRIDIALTYIYGIGRATAVEILEKAKVDGTTRSRAHRPRCRGYSQRDPRWLQGGR